MEWTVTEEGLPEAAKACWAAFPHARVFAFSGGLGAGKTSFIKALCVAKGVADHVTSPTFSIINEYHFPGGLIYHMDLYRLKDADEAIDAGVAECLDSGEFCLVEWPGRAMELLPPDTQFIEIETMDPQTRKIRAGDR